MKKLIYCTLLCSTIVYTMKNQSPEHQHQEPENKSDLNKSYKQKKINGMLIIESQTEVTTIRAYELATKVKEAKD